MMHFLQVCIDCPLEVPPTRFPHSTVNAARLEFNQPCAGPHSPVVTPQPALLGDPEAGSRLQGRQPQSAAPLGDDLRRRHRARAARPLQRRPSHLARRRRLRLDGQMSTKCMSASGRTLCRNCGIAGTGGPWQHVFMWSMTTRDDNSHTSVLSSSRITATTVCPAFNEQQRGGRRALLMICITDFYRGKLRSAGAQVRAVQRRRTIGQPATQQVLKAQRIPLLRMANVRLSIRS